MNNAGLDLSILNELLRKDCPYINRVMLYPVAPSTQSMAISAGNMGAPEGTVIIAKTQVAGRGRGNHNWFSPPGGLYASIVLRPRFDIRKWPFLTLMSGASISQKMRMLGVDSGLKWPNDVNIEGRKVAGFLARAIPEKGFVVLGVGINLILPEDVLMPDDINDSTTTLYEHLKDHSITPEAIASGMITGILSEYKTIDPEMDLIKINALLDHETLYNFKELRGFQKDILPDMSLRLELQSGITRTLGFDYAACD